MRAYHRLDPLMDERKSHYTPAQLGAFVKVQLLAGRQTHRGRFRSQRALEGALPAAYAKHVPFLIAQHDLVALPDGTLYLDGWDEWQEGDVTVKERMARLRNRHRNSTVTGDAAEPSPTAIRSSVGVGVGVDVLSDAHGARALPDEMERHGLPHLVGDAQQIIEEAVGRSLTTCHGWPATELDRLLEERPATLASVPAAVRVAGSHPSWSQFVNALRDIVEPRPKVAEADAARKADESDADWQRRTEATRRRNAEMREAMGYSR